MATINLPIQNKRTSTPGKAPTTADILVGQIFINLADRRIYTKDNTNTIIPLGVISSDLATVAITGQYADLLGLPTIPPAYVLPAATTTLLGGIKQGDGVSITVDGTLSAAVLSVRGEFGVTQDGDVILTREDLGLDILDANDKILPQYLPDSITGAMVYKGTYDADTDTPALPDAGTGNLGWLYVVSVAGTYTPPVGSPVVVAIGDWLISDGTVWQKVSAVAGEVLTVNGQTGNITINATNLPGLAVVGRTGQWTDLLGKPTFAPVATSGAYADLSGKPDLATVATTGSYNDLLNLPPNPTVTDIAVCVNGTPILEPQSYIFTRPMQFPDAFAGSQAFARMQTGTVASIRIMKAVAATPTTYTQIGSLSINTTTNVATFSTIDPAPTTFQPGDVLRYEWISSGIASISISLRATRL